MSIRKRALPRTGETRWLVDYRDQQGKRRAKQFETKAAAISYETKIRGEIATGTHVADSASTTLGTAADLWVASGERDGLEATTVRQRRQHADLHIKPVLGATKSVAILIDVSSRVSEWSPNYRDHSCLSMR